MEGVFSLSTEKTPNEIAHRAFIDIASSRNMYRICSLSRHINKRLLWAHYSSGFTGIAIEVELDIDGKEVCEVTYSDVIPDLKMEGNEFDADSGSRRILLTKHIDWEYEGEVRILKKRDSRYFDLASGLKRVIVGHRMDQETRAIFRVICDSYGIELYSTGLSDKGVAISPLPRERRS